MCGGNCLWACTSNVGYVFEKLASYIAMTAVIICIMITMAISTGLGVGLGYNYCFVDHKTASVEQASLPNNEPAARRVGSTHSSFRRGMATSKQSQQKAVVPPIKQTITIPLHGNVDFSSLLSKLRARNQNVTLELIT